MVRSLFPLCVMFLCCRVEGWERQIVGAGEKKKPREVEPAAQFESLSATGFSFPLPLLSVCFVSSFVRLCLDSERVHAARHVIALLFKQGLFSSQLLYPTQDVYSYSKRNYSSPSTCLCGVQSLGLLSVRSSVCLRTDKELGVLLFSTSNAEGIVDGHVEIKLV